MPPTQYLKKRDLLHGAKSTPAVLSQAGREYLKQEAFSDALDFFEKARDEAGIAEIKRIARERGDSFLLNRLERFDARLVQPEDWQAVIQVAEKNGMESMARFARRRLEPPKAVSPAPVAPGEQPLEEA